MAKLKKLTKEQEELMITIRDKWMDFIFSCKNTEIKKDQCIEGINFIYNLAGKKPPEVLFVNSPMGVQYEYHLITNLTKGKIGDSVGNSVRDSVRASVWDSVRNSVKAEKMNYQQTSYYGNIGDYGWVAFYDYFTRIGALNNEKFNKFQSLIESGVYDMLQYENLCIVCSLPIYISRNQEGRLHNLEEAAIRFKDGYEQHYIQGVFISHELFGKLSKEQYYFDDFIKEENEEIKAACMFFIREKFGENALYKLFDQNLKEVNTYIHKKDSTYLEGTTKGMNVGVYTLFKGQFGNTEIAYVRCYCPSTDRMFYLGVESSFIEAKDAIASLYRIPEKLQPHIKEIKRQGERFSTTFTEKGLNLLNSISKEEAENLVSISGKEYFEKMTYEF